MLSRGAEYLNLALLPKNVPMSQTWCQPAIGNVSQLVHSDSPGEGQRLNPVLPMPKAGFAVTPLVSCTPRHWPGGHAVPQLQLADGISIQHGCWDLCAVWSEGPLSSMVGETSVQHSQCDRHPAWLVGPLCSVVVGHA